MLRDAYGDEGFVRGGLAVNLRNLERLRAEADRYLSEGASQDFVKRMRSLADSSDGRCFLQVLNLWQYSRAFEDVVTCPSIVGQVVEILRPKVLRLWHDQLLVKPPRRGAEYSWHQDMESWRNLAEGTDVITAWIALDSADLENGCMEMVVGSHRWGCQHEALRAIRNGGAFPSKVNGVRVVCRECCVEAGFAHFHHPLTWHRSRSNLSGRPRRAFAIHYLGDRIVFRSADGSTSETQFVDGDGQITRLADLRVIWRPAGL